MKSGVFSSDLPVHAGRFFIYRTPDLGKIPAGVTPLLVDAGQAFGTGHHETTTGCLEFISELVRPGVHINALDIGTGTGELAVAIAKLAHCNVLASDIDHVAVQVTRDNARTNGTSTEERLVGKRRGSTCRSRWSTYH